MGKKILVVDDDQQIVLLLASRLRSNEYEIIVAYDAVQAVARAFSEKPDLILLDMKMPAGGGISVMEKLKNSAHTATTPVIIITAYPSKEIKEKVKEMGAVSFISKPFKAEDVLLEIKKALGEAIPEEEDYDI